MVHFWNRVLPQQLFLWHFRAQITGARTHIAVCQLEPCTGKGIGKLVRIFKESPGYFFIHRVKTQGKIGGKHGRQVLFRCVKCIRNDGFGIDDAYIAGRVVVGALGGSRSRKGLSDSAIAAVDLVRRYGDRLDRVLAISSAGRALTRAGYRADIGYAAQVDAHPVVPAFHDRRVTLAAGGTRS